MFASTRIAILIVTAITASTIAETEPQTDVPIQRVVLFTSGVGFFEHAGQVNGDATTELRFKSSQINDMLKSLVLQDLDGGRIGSVIYPSRDPLSKTLRSFQVDIRTNPSLGELLNQLRGAEVSVEAQGSKMSGTILGLEKTKRKISDDEAVDSWMLNIFAGGTIRSVDLADTSLITLQDEELQKELSKALLALSQARDQDKKPVTIEFSGDGTRRVRVGYVVETPVWKTTYRLIMPADDDVKVGSLQGWAIVENQTESDWSDVELSLVSGRPISFIQDLYQPLYVRRPVVQPDLFASLSPQMYDEGTGGGGFGGGGGGLGGGYGTAAAPQASHVERIRGRKGKSARMRLRDDSVAVGAIAASPFEGSAQEEVDYAQSVSSLASAGDMGELFEYQVDAVTLPRQRSAMIPIVTDDIEVERVSIYNQNVLGKHPLNGARLTNSTGKDLPQGPITVLDDGGYSGDARIDHFPPGQSRLLSYAVDLDVRVDATKFDSTDHLQTGSLVRGVLMLKRKLAQTQTYAIENKGTRDRALVVEHSRNRNWTLVEPKKPFETTENLYRFKLDVEPGGKKDFTVMQEYTREVQMALLSADIDRIQFFIKAREIPKPVKAALQKAMQMKQAIVAINTELRQHNETIQRITEEQKRIRANMGSVKQNSEYYTRLLTKLNDQETIIENEQTIVAKLQAKIDTQRDELANYLNTLTVN